MHGNLFYGCGTALVTPFRGNRVDFDALEGLIDWQLDSGADAVVALGTTGEPAAVTDSERSAIIECAAARCLHRAPLVVGTGSNDTRRAVAQSVEARRLGADALLVVTPYYNRASRAGLIAHFNAVADSVDIPVIMYNVPARTGVNLDAETVAELAKHPNLCAVKEASGSLRQMTDLARACGDGVAIYCGNDDQIPAAMALGARGAISVAANIIMNRNEQRAAEAQTAAVSVSAPGGRGTFFDAYRSERDSVRTQELAYLDAIVAQGGDESTLSDAQKQKMTLVSCMESELNTENLIRAKGFEEVIVSMHNGSVNVIVDADALTDEQVAQILDIVLRETGETAENIKVSTAQ